MVNRSLRENLPYYSLPSLQNLALPNVNKSWGPFDARMTTLAFCTHISSFLVQLGALSLLGLDPFLSPTSHRQACTLRLSSFSSVRYRFRDRHVMFHAYLFVIMIAFCDPLPLVLVLDVSRPLHDARLDELRSSLSFSFYPIHLNYDLFTLIRVTPCLIRTGIWVLMFTKSLLYSFCKLTNHSC